MRDVSKVTPETLTVEMIREFESLGLCSDCGEGLLAPQHHNELMDDGHRFASFRDTCVTAMHEWDYPSARIEARQRICDAINACAKEIK